MTTATRLRDPFDPAIAEAFDAATRDVNEAAILPPVLYTSEEFFAFEREAIFGREWLCVGRLDQVPGPGDWFAIEIAGEPLLVVRDKSGPDGETPLRVLSAVCQHRGMVVAEGRGHCSTFRCPYHHWTYGLDGRLLGAPAMERAVGFDKADYGLPSLPVETWNGFVFCCLDPSPPPFAPGLRKLTELLEHLDLAHAHTVVGETYTDLPWNWKVMFENFNDGYHAHRLHQGIGDFVPGDNARFLEWDDDDTHVTRLNYFTHADGSFNPMAKVIMPVFRGLTDDERWRAMFSLVPPTLGLAIVPDGVTYFVINPKSAASIDIHIGYCFDPAAPGLPLFDKLLAQAKSGVDNFNVQDIWADTLVQKGLSSRFGPHGRYSWQEETLRQFNRWLVRRYRAHWPAGAAAAAEVRA
jgi:phenylpropionate dioxygenase-like ring-hydroxylating dioxygenase large terminal subunit